MKFAIAALIGLTSAANLNKLVEVLPVETDEGFVMMKVESFQKLQLKNKSKKMEYNKPSDYLCDGDKADDKEILDAADPEDTIVEDFGFSGSRNARGQVRMLQLNQIDNYPINEDHQNILIQNMKYSDELANGDRDDDKENQFEHDPTDPIVDYNGHTNRGYGHTPYDQVDAPYRFDKQHYETNHVKDLFPEHFGTKPQGDNPFCSTC